MNKAKQFTKENGIHTLKVMGFLSASACLTYLISIIPNVELGVWAPLVMAGLNALLVVVKEWLNQNR